MDEKTILSTDHLTLASTIQIGIWSGRLMPFETEEEKQGRIKRSEYEQLYGKGAMVIDGTNPERDAAIARASGVRVEAING